MPRFKLTPFRHWYGCRFLIIAFSMVAVIIYVGSLCVTKAQAPAAGDIVFSQVYTRGGNPGSTYKNNFIELFNRSNAPVDFSGRPLHIASDTGNFNVAISFASSRGLIIPPGGYLLIEFETAPGSPGGPLPFFDLFVPQSIPITLFPSGKLAITNPGTTLSGTCPAANPGVMDFIGYGSTTNCFEGSGPTATLSTTTSALRNAAGCTDTNNNASDFTVGTPTPRNSSSTKHACSANQIDDAEFFVRQHYTDFLNRQPDAAGLAFWRDQITSCGTNQMCIEVKRINVSAAFFLSIEFQETGYLVYRTYKAAYGNLSQSAPVPLTFAEFLPDTQQTGQGVVVNAPGWEQQLENNKVAFFLDFVSRLRFRNAYPTTLSPADFIDALFAKAGVAPSAAERSAAIGDFGLATDTSDTAARARGLRRIAENATLALQERNRAFVLMQYFGYLRRNPNDAPEPGLNFDGYNFWLNKLNQFNGDYIAAEMVKAFIDSIEYRQRFGL